MEYKTDEQAETLTCISTLAPGQYLMKIEYTGMHNDKRMGFYRTKFEVSFELLMSQCLVRFLCHSSNFSCAVKLQPLVTAYRHADCAPVGDCGHTFRQSYCWRLFATMYLALA